MIDIRKILGRLPHRYPFLLVDRIVDLEPSKRVVAVKNVSFNEPFFQGHFPEAPVMPGVLIVEAMAQAGAFLLLGEIPDAARKLVYFTGIDGARFRRAVIPGDVLKIHVEVLRLRPSSAKMRGTAEVDGQLAAQAELMSALVDREA